MYTGGFIGFIILMAILEQMGMSAATIGILFVAFTISSTWDWLAVTYDGGSAYYVAGRELPAVYNGYGSRLDVGRVVRRTCGWYLFGGYSYLAFIVGWTGGYVLVNSLAPYLRNSGATRSQTSLGHVGGNTARFCAVLVLMVTPSPM